MAGKIETFEDLNVWKKAHELVLHIYRVTGRFPQDEKYGLVSQMRRAAVSVPANIAEGFKRRGRKDKINFYNISKVSLNELRYHILLSKDLKYICDFEEGELPIDHVGGMLNGLITSIAEAHNH